MRKDNKIFKELLTKFVTEEDPILSMLKWMMEQLMEIEAEQKVGAKKHEHNSNRKSFIVQDVLILVWEQFI